MERWFPARCARRDTFSFDWLHTLRQECDRGLATEIERFGGGGGAFRRVDITHRLGPDLEVAAWNDHRMAMAELWDWCVLVYRCVIPVAWERPSRVLE